MDDGKQKSKNAPAVFLNSGEQTEQNFLRGAARWNYVPKTDYSGFVGNQMHEIKNTKKYRNGLFSRHPPFLVILSAAKDLTFRESDSSAFGLRMTKFLILHLLRVLRAEFKNLANELKDNG